MMPVQKSLGLPDAMVLLMKPGQSAYTPAFLMIGPHLSISDFKWVRRASGVARSLETGSVPSSPNRWISDGSVSATWRADARASMIAFGVPLGAYSPCHTETSKFGSPASCMVGTSGSEATRFLVVTP